MFTKHIRMKLGDGSKIRFWEDPWLQEGTLKDTFPLLYKISRQKSELIGRMGWFEGNIWRWTLAWKRELRREETQQAATLFVVLAQNHPQCYEVDGIVWKEGCGYT